MKVFALRPNESWIVDRIVSEWNEGNNNLVSSIQDADVIWLAADWCWRQVPVQLLSSKKVIATVHHIVPNKFLVQEHHEFIARDLFVNAYHCPNKRTADFIASLTSKPIHIIPYWCNENIWSINSYIEKDVQQKELGIPPSKFIIGSFQRDTEGSDLKTPKLEKGPDLFCDAIEKFATQHDNLHILLGGWRRQYVINRLNQAKIPFTYIERGSIATIRRMYWSLDLYLVTSRYEGGPQALLEAASMKVPIVSTPVGIAEQVLDSSSIHEDVTQAVPNVEAAYEKIQSLKTFVMFPKYRRMFSSVIE